MAKKALTKLNPETLRSHKGVSYVGVSVTFLCHDGQGRFFMAKRSKNARDEQGRWEPGGGGLKHGQTIEETLRREIKEEYLADILATDFLGYDEIFRELNDGTPTHWISFRYAVLVDPKQVKIGEPELFDDSGWFTLQTLPAPLHSQMQPFLKKYQKQLAKILGS